MPPHSFGQPTPAYPSAAIFFQVSLDDLADALTLAEVFLDLGREELVVVGAQLVAQRLVLLRQADVHTGPSAVSRTCSMLAVRRPQLQLRAPDRCRRRAVCAQYGRWGSPSRTKPRRRIRRLRVLDRARRRDRGRRGRRVRARADRARAAARCPKSRGRRVPRRVERGRHAHDGVAARHSRRADLAADRDLAREVGAGEPARSTRARASSATRTAAARPRRTRAHVDVAGFGPVEWNGTLAPRAGQAAEGDAVWRSTWQPERSLSRACRRASTSTFNRVVADARADHRGRRIVPRRVAGDREDRARARSHHEEPAADQEADEVSSSAPTRPTSTPRCTGPGVRPNYFVEIATRSRRRALPRPCCARSSRRSPGVFFQHDHGRARAGRACSARSSSATSARSPPSG